MKRHIAAAAALLALIAGCTTTPTNATGPAPDTATTTVPTPIHTAEKAPATPTASTAWNTKIRTQPQPVGTPAPMVKPAVTLPFSWSESPLVDTGWSQPPQGRDDFFVGFAAPTTSSGRLEFSVVDVYGTVRWRAERPATCTGYAVSRTADNTPIIVLTDSHAGATPGRFQTTASAYNMATGAPVWGPVDVPGTVQGPGLVFGASPAATLGAVGPRIALDASTGHAVADEATTPATTIIGEYDGTVLLARDGTLTAINAGSKMTLWTVTSPVGATVTSRPDYTPIAGAATITGGNEAALIDLTNGDVIATNIDDAGRDALSRTWVWVTGSTVHGHSDTGGSWNHPMPATPSITAIGGGLVYLRYGSTVHVLNTLTGRDAQGYPPHATDGYAIPQTITDNAAAIFRIHGTELIATIEAPPG